VSCDGFIFFVSLVCMPKKFKSMCFVSLVCMPKKFKSMVRFLGIGPKHLSSVLFLIHLILSDKKNLQKQNKKKQI